MPTKSYTFFLIFILNLVFLSNLSSTQTTKIKVIAFDFGGVIATGDKQEIGYFIEKALDLPSGTGEELQLDVKKYLKQGGQEENFWVLFAQNTGKILPENWLEKLDLVRLKAIKEIPGMVNIVKNLQKQGFQTALLSNISISQAKLRRQLGYYNLFHPVLLSYQIAADKPDEKAYQILLDTLKVPPASVLFIDNKAANIKTAKSMGIDAILFSNADQLILELKQRDIQVSKLNPDESIQKQALNNFPEN